MERAKGAGICTRRGFLRGAAAATAFSIVPRHVLGGPGFVPPSEKVNVAVVGAGGMGLEDVKQFLKEPDAQICAVCDVAEVSDLHPFWYNCFAGRRPVKKLVDDAVAKTTGFKCAEYEDFREMLAEDKDIDAVLCATPDHLHATVSIAALRAGKHVYCEKPLGHSVEEVRLMAKVARETGLATQMGNFGHSGAGIRMTCEWIWDGAIGPVREVHAWSSMGKWAEGMGRPKGTPPVPAGFNWDLWLGPREPRPYSPAYAPYSWRGWWAFGTGAIGDMACHNMDPAVEALRLGAPSSIEASAVGPVDSEVTTYGAMYTYRFPARGGMPPVKMTWYSGGLMPPWPEGVDADDPRQRLGEGEDGILFVGDKGYITCPGWSGTPRLLPLSLNKEYKKPAPTLPRIQGSHHGNWLAACKGRGKASTDFEYGARLTEIVLLGNVALRCGREQDAAATLGAGTGKLRPGKKLLWDAAAMKATNAPEADKYLRDTYRKGWELV
jgi:predicted dehydrogenase